MYIYLASDSSPFLSESEAEESSEKDSEEDDARGKTEKDGIEVEYSSVGEFKSSPQVVKLMETWFHQPNPEMERRATQLKIADETYSYSPACLGREALAGLLAERDRHE